MHKRDHDEAKRLAEKIEQYCRVTARSDIRLLKEDGSLNHNRIAEDIATKTERNFSQSTLTRLLNGQVSSPSIGTLRTLATYFGISVADLRKESEGGAAPKTVRAKDSWPFLFAPQRWDRLLETQKRFIEGEVERLVRAYEAGSHPFRTKSRSTKKAG